MTWRSVPNALLSAADALAKGTAALAAGAVAFIFLAMLAEIVSRNVLGRSLLFSWEISSYLLSAAIFLAAANAARLDVHVRVGLAGELLTPRLAASLEVAWLVVALVLTSYLLYAMADLALDSLRRGALAPTPLRTPIGYSHLVNAIGVATLVLQIAARLMRSALGLAMPVSARTSESVSP